MLHSGGVVAVRVWSEAVCPRRISSTWRSKPLSTSIPSRLGADIYEQPDGAHTLPSASDPFVLRFRDDVST